MSESSISSFGLGGVDQNWTLGSSKVAKPMGGADRDGDADGDAGRPDVDSRSGPMAGAILQTLTRVGITGNKTLAATGSSTDPTALSAGDVARLPSSAKDALSAFMRSLFESLQSQSADVVATAATRAQPGGFQQDLQALISNLGTGGGSAAQLSADYQNLVTALGGQGNGASLDSVLKALVQRLSGQENQGVLVSARA